MIALVIFASLAAGAASGVLLMAAVASGAREDVYRAGICRGRQLERSDALAQALWEADNLTYGGSE